jgi:hypothetical protein
VSNQPCMAIGGRRDGQLLPAVGVTFIDNELTVDGCLERHVYRRQIVGYGTLCFDAFIHESVSDDEAFAILFG